MGQEVLSWKNQLDVLINNASSFYPTPLEEANEEHWDNLIGSNLKAPYFLCQTVAHGITKKSGKYRHHCRHLCPKSIKRL